MQLNGNAFENVMSRYAAMRSDVLVLKDARKFPEALVKAKQAVDFLEQQQEGLAYLLDAANYLGTLYGAIGNWQSAEQVFEQSRYIREEIFGTKNKETATALMMLGTAKYSLGKYSEAELLMQSCLQIREELFGPSHQEVALVLANLAAVYDKTERSAEAAMLRERSDRIGLTGTYTDTFGGAVIANDANFDETERESALRRIAAFPRQWPEMPPDSEDLPLIAPRFRTLVSIGVGLFAGLFVVNLIPQEFGLGKLAFPVIGAAIALAIWLALGHRQP